MQTKEPSPHLTEHADNRDKRERLEAAVEALRQKHGDASIMLGCQDNAEIGIRRGKG